MPINTAWFQNRIADRRMSQRALARALGMDPGALSLTLRGKRTMKMTEAADIARLLGVPAEEVIEHAGVRVSSKNTLVPITATMDGTCEIHMDANLGMNVPHPGGDVPEKCYAALCRTEGTDLSHMDGWLMFTEEMRPSGGIAPESVGRLSACRVRNGCIYIARLMRSHMRGRWTLQMPTGTMPDVDVEWAKPIILIKT